MERRRLDSVATTSAVSGIEFYLDHFYDLLRLALHKLRVASGVAARSVRFFLVAAGFPAKKRLLVLPCNGGCEASGLFSEFAAVLGLLEHHERWRKIYAGVRVDFKDQGLYFDPAFGFNWWEYYFEPVAIGSGENAVTRIVGAWQHDRFAWRAERKLSRKRGAELVNRYIRVKPHIREKVEIYVRENFSDCFVIGIHYRGTDKEAEAPRVPYGKVLAAVHDAIGNIKTDQYRLFLATDEQAFLDYMLNFVPGNLKYCAAIRSIDGIPVHEQDGNNFKKGEEAVIDCLLLSRCHFLIRTASNLSLCAALFNPAVPEILLKHPN